MNYNKKAIMEMAWKIKRKTGLTFAASLCFSWRLTKKEICLKKEDHRTEGVITWNIWTGYGITRAYFTCSWYSKYSNSKRNHYIEH